MNNFFWVRSFHLLKVPSFSIWPIIGSMGAFLLTSGGVYWWHNSFSYVFFLALFVLLLTMLFWWRDMMNEGFFGGHSSSFLDFLRVGVILFMLSEVCFFASFFWGFFHMCWSPAEELGGYWPPFFFKDIMMDPFSVPLLNTMMLLSSGVSITASHYFIMVSEGRASFKYGGFFLGVTVFLGVVFLILQVEEYASSYLSFFSSVYGSSFFILTGFHGLHVTIGAIALTVVFIRHYFKSFSSYDHLGFEAAAWYWHFVDVVWLFLFMFVYWLGAPM